MPLAKKAIDWLSGDQNGLKASSVPSSRRALVDSRWRKYKRVFVRVVTARTSERPSGEIADEIPRIP
jgi:hypothetical protein